MTLSPSCVDLSSDLKNGEEQYDASYFPITEVTRAAYTKYCSMLPGVPEAIIDGRNELAAAIARGEVDASASPAVAGAAPAGEEFSL